MELTSPNITKFNMNWRNKNLESLTKNIASGKSLTNNSNGEYPIYGSTGIIGFSKNFDYEGIKLLVARVGANAGTINRVIGKYCVSDNTLMVTTNSEYDTNFAYYQLLYFNLNKLVFGSGQPLITGGQLKQIELNIPPTLTEQKAIADALTDVDELITNLEKLIAKKKAIKQGAMQQLLKPKKDWRTVTIYELAEEKKSNFDDGDWIESEYIIDSGIRLIQTGNIGVGCFIEKETKKYISNDSFIKLRCKEVLKGDLLICRLAEPAGRACVMPNIGEQKVITSVDVSIFRGDTELVEREFLSQYFTTSKWFNQVLERVGGTTHKRISRGALGKIQFKIPNIEQQKEIASILSEMDKEVELLENKKDKMIGFKQGMMQELLTGKTRLI